MSTLPTHASRSLMAVLFTDAVAFSARAHANEEAAHQLLRHDFDVMTLLCAKHRGSVIKSTGDGLLMSFDSAAQAVDCAMAIQARFASRPEHYLQHRIGVHLCDVIEDQGDVHGDGVNLASRLESLASPGGICLSQTIYEVVKGRLAVQARSLGAQQLKNLMEPVMVYEISPTGAPKVHSIAPPGYQQLAVPAQPRQDSKLAYFVVGGLVFLGLCIVAGALFMSRGSNSATVPQRPGLVVNPNARPGEPGFVPNPNAKRGEPGYIPKPGEPGFRPGPGQPGYLPRPGEPGFDPQRFPRRGQ